ncbi:hypothetical protein SESBI_40800 [Sesbania bispinosa]|nr:hypothetical protein SESBI_40800 [Sesbania bispinosa]
MAAPGSLNKSEEEWQVNPSPQLFRILGYKGTECLRTFQSLGARSSPMWPTLPNKARRLVYKDMKRLHSYLDNYVAGQQSMLAKQSQSTSQRGLQWGNSFRGSTL